MSITETIVTNVVDSYVYNWYDDWDNYSIYYDEESDSIKDTITSTSRFGGSNPTKGITSDKFQKAYNAWKRQAVAKIHSERKADSIIPSVGKEVIVGMYKRGKHVHINGMIGTVIWAGKRRKFQFRDYPYHRDYMDEKVVKVEIDGNIYWIPFTKCQVVNSESYVPSEEQIYDMVEEYVSHNYIPWIYVVDNCKWKWYNHYNKE